MRFLKRVTFTCYGVTTVYGSGAQIAANDSDIATNVSDISDLAGGVDTDTVDSVGTVTTKAGLAGVEKGNAAMHKTVLTLTAVSMTITDGSTEGTDAAWGNQSIYTFPEGHVVIHSAHAVFGDDEIVAGEGGIIDTADLEWGIGTTARTNVSDFALGATEKDIVPEKVMAQMVGGMSNGIESQQATASLFKDGSAGAIEAFLNFISSHNDDVTTADTLAITGVITFVWSMQGDD